MEARKEARTFGQSTNALPVVSSDHDRKDRRATGQKGREKNMNRLQPFQRGPVNDRGAHHHKLDHPDETFR